MWPGLVTSCGCLGVVSKLTLELVNDYAVDEAHYTGGSIEGFIRNFRTILATCDSFNGFAAWPTDTMMWVQLQHYRTLGGGAPQVRKTPFWPTDAWTRTGANFSLL